MSELKVTHLTIDLKNNGIKAHGAETLSSAIGKISTLEWLTMNFGGYSKGRNHLGDEGANAVGKAIGNLKNLRELNLELGLNNIHDAGMTELAHSLKVSPKITYFTLGASGNHITKGAVKIGKALIKSGGATHVTLNFNSCEMDKQSGTDLVGSLRRNENITDLTFFGRNNKRAEFDNAKIDLEENK